MAAKYWVTGGTGNWSSTSNWSTTSGGASGAAVPSNADDVTFDVNGNSNCTLDAAIGKNAKTVTVTSGYTSNWAMNVNLNVAGSVTLGANMTITGSSTLVVNATATLTSNGKSFPNLLNLSTGSLTYTFADNWSVGSVTTGSSTVLNGSQLTTNTLTIGGTTTGTTNIVLGGTGTWSTTSGALTNNLTFNSSGTVTLTGTNVIAAGITVTYTAGTISASGSTLNFTNTGTYIMNTNGMTWGNVSTNVATTVTITNNSVMTIGGNFTSGIGVSTHTYNGSDIQIGGNLNLNSITTGSITGTAKIVLNGTGTWSMTGATTGSLKSNTDINTSGTITLSGNLNYSTNTLTYVAGTVTPGASTLTLLVNGVTISGTNPGLTLGAVATAVNVTFAGANGFSMISFTNTTSATTLTIQSTNTYNISGAFTFTGIRTSNISMAASTASSAALWIVAPSATIEVARANATDINSGSTGRTVWDYGSSNTLTRTTNWISFVQPGTVGASAVA